MKHTHRKPAKRTTRVHRIRWQFVVFTVVAIAVAIARAYQVELPEHQLTTAEHASLIVELLTFFIPGSE